MVRCEQLKSANIEHRLYLLVYVSSILNAEHKARTRDYKLVVYVESPFNKIETRNEVWEVSRRCVQSLTSTLPPDLAHLLQSKHTPADVDLHAMQRFGE